VINLKEDFVPKKERTYLMLRQEKEEVQEFMEEQLRKGYIRPSKLLQTSCYESSKKKIVFHAFKHLIHNIKTYNEVKI